MSAVTVLGSLLQQRAVVFVQLISLLPSICQLLAGPIWLCVNCLSVRTISCVSFCVQ